jgi:nitrous oxide reductase accessory protein NosL
MSRRSAAVAALLVTLAAAGCTKREEPAPVAPPVVAEPVQRGKF